MKSLHFFFFLTIAFSFQNVYVQDQSFSRQKVNEVLTSYKKSIQAFMNLELCGNFFDGSAYMVKRTENYSLDRLIEITPEQEADLGLKIFNESESSNLVNNPLDLNRVRNMVIKLATNSIYPTTNYHVFIIKSDEINAFSTIGEYIYITSALMNFVKSSDELAFVLGHEIYHIINKHLVRKEKKIALLSYEDKKMDFKLFSSVALNINMTLSAPFDQIDEYDADISSVDLIKKAGYNQTAFNDFFLKLEHFDKKDLLSTFTSTHPLSVDRRRCLNKAISK